MKALSTCTFCAHTIWRCFFGGQYGHTISTYVDSPLLLWSLPWNYIHAISDGEGDLEVLKVLRERFRDEYALVHVLKIRFKHTQVFLCRHPNVSKVVLVEHIWVHDEQQGLFCEQEAVEIFNLSMPRFRTAAEFYVLDGFVTEHLGILEDSSQLYKYLAVFEKCTHRKVGRRLC